MFKGFFTVAALLAIAGYAQAGSLQNGAWTPNCPELSPAPQILSTNANAYNESGKAAQAWQANAKAYAACLNSEAKADQGTIVDGANAKVKVLSDQIDAMNAANAAAIDKLKAKSK